MFLGGIQRKQRQPYLESKKKKKVKAREKIVDEKAQENKNLP